MQEYSGLEEDLEEIEKTLQEEALKKKHQKTLSDTQHTSSPKKPVISKHEGKVKEINENRPFSQAASARLPQNLNPYQTVSQFPPSERLYTSQTQRVQNLQKQQEMVQQRLQQISQMKQVYSQSSLPKYSMRQERTFYSTQPLQQASNNQDLNKIHLSRTKLYEQPNQILEQAQLTLGGRIQQKTIKEPKKPLLRCQDYYQMQSGKIKQNSVQQSPVANQEILADSSVNMGPIVFRQAQEVKGTKQKLQQLQNRLDRLRLEKEMSNKRVFNIQKHSKMLEENRLRYQKDIEYTKRVREQEEERKQQLKEKAKKMKAERVREKLEAEKQQNIFKTQLQQKAKKEKEEMKEKIQVSKMQEYLSKLEIKTRITQEKAFHSSRSFQEKSVQLHQTQSNYRLKLQDQLLQQEENERRVLELEKEEQMLIEQLQQTIKQEQKWIQKVKSQEQPFK